MSRNYSVRISLVLGILTVAFVPWVLFFRQNPPPLPLAAAGSNFQSQVKIQPIVRYGISEVPKSNGVINLTIQEAKALGMDLSSILEPEVTPELCVKYAKKYGLTTEEATTLLMWPGTFGRENDCDQEASKVAVICVKHQLSFQVVRELMGHCGEARFGLIYFNYYPSHGLVLHFTASGEFRGVEIVGRAINPDGSLKDTGDGKGGGRGR